MTRICLIFLVAQHSTRLAFSGSRSLYSDYLAFYKPGKQGIAMRLFPALAVSAIFVLVASGCANPTEPDRLACLELAKYSFAGIPDCDSQEKCFAEAKGAAGIDLAMLSPSAAAEVFNAENHLARAWLSLNLAKKNLAAIRENCSNGDFSKIPKEANELNSNLLDISRSIDSFNKSAALAITIENGRLLQEDIELIREEPLYDDFIALNQNILDFSQNNDAGKTYASRFLHEYSKFKKIADALEISGHASEIPALKQIGKAISITSTIKFDDFNIKLLSPLFGSISSFISDFIAMKGSVSELAIVPAFDAFLAMDRIIASENS